MLNKISWSSFIWILSLILTVYYLFVLVSFYRKEIFSLGTINKKSIAEITGQNIQLNNKPNHPDIPSVVAEKAGEDSFTVVHELLEDFKKLFLHASETKMIREELIQAIRSKLKRYPLIGETDLVEDINTHIILEAKEKCAVELLPEDLKQIWI